MEVDYSQCRKFARAAREFTVYIDSNADSLINYCERFRAGERISSCLAESTVNAVISKRFAKRQQMQWAPRGAHILLQTRNPHPRWHPSALFERWYPGLMNEQRGGSMIARLFLMLPYEAAGRIGEAITPGFRQRGFHGCLVAIFAAAVAAARLLRPDAAQTAQAIALSATSIGGLAAAANTSVAREYHAGLAARLGLEAVLAAQRGYRAEESILEARHGSLEAYGGVDGNTASVGITRDLRRSWDIVTDMAVKLVPGGHPSHALAEAAANTARDADIAPGEIPSITVSRPGIPGSPARCIRPI